MNSTDSPKDADAEAEAVTVESSSEESQKEKESEMEVIELTEEDEDELLKDDSNDKIEEIEKDVEMKIDEPSVKDANNEPPKDANNEPLKDANNEPPKDSDDKMEIVENESGKIKESDVEVINGNLNKKSESDSNKEQNEIINIEKEIIETIDKSDQLPEKKSEDLKNSEVDNVPSTSGLVINKTNIVDSNSNSNGESSNKETKQNDSEKIECNKSSDKSTLSSDEQDSNIQKLLKTNSENEKREKAALLDNQVQCVNLHCQSGYGLTEAPVFVLTYFGVLRRKNVLQKVCKECFNIALNHQELLAGMLTKHKPLMSVDFPRQKDDVVVMDSVDEIYEEDPLPANVIAEVENQLMKLMAEAVKKHDIDYQIEEAQNILSQKYDVLEDSNKAINDELKSIENSLKDMRHQMYKDFTPRIRQLPALNIMEPPNRPYNMIQAIPVQLNQIPRNRIVAAKKVTQVINIPKCVLPPTYVAPADQPSHDIVAVEEVEVPQIKLPPIGSLKYPQVTIGDLVYVMKVSCFGVWVKGKVVEVGPRSAEGVGSYKVRTESSYRAQGTKTVTGKQMAYSKPSAVRYPVGTRVIAVFQNTDSPGKEAYYVGLIAEPPKHLNKFRYLVFFDDGYAQYVPHERIHLVCECSRLVYEDVHEESRDFIKLYLDRYPERPMVKLQQGQVVRTEWNGKWWWAKAVEIDCSLAKMVFEADKRVEWIYRGSARLGPLFAEMSAAAARKEQGALSRHRSLGIASLKKRNMAYVEYTVEQDETKGPPSQTGVSKNVAKKSTARTSNTDFPTDRTSGPPKPFEKMEYPTKGYVRVMDVKNRVVGKSFTPHQCGPSCMDWVKFEDANRRGINPLSLPLLYGFERQTLRLKGKRSIMYRGPCGRRIRNMIEMHRYLRITKATMGLELFDFDYWVRVLDEFHLERSMLCTHVEDISYGRENTPVPCVNEINHSWPLFMDYSTQRLPQDGVNINLDEEFLVCCDCTDDCQDKEKCQCWQLTIEGTKLGPGGEADPSVGYQFRRLPEPVTTGIYECNQKCKCSKTCLNRVAQHPLQLNLQVFRTLKKGWGIRAVNDIPRGSFICIYAGRLHTEQAANDGGRMYGDEYLAELDYIEVVERFKEGYESEVVDPEGRDRNEDDEEDENDHLDDDDPAINRDYYEDKDYVPEGLNRVPHTEKVFTTRARQKKIESSSEKSESETEKDGDKEEKSSNKSANKNEGSIASGDGDDDEDDMKKKPSKFTPALSVEDRPRKFKSVREYFGDGADDCYIMDAKSSGNIGRYLNHSCQPNVFVQNVFVDTHDVRFPWVSFFALSHIKAGMELTWDYNYDIGSVPGKVLYCYCNNGDCRGRLL